MRNWKTRTFLLLLFVLTSNFVKSQAVSMNRTGLGLASVTLHPKDLPISPPFIPLQDGVLTLSFDDLRAEYASYNVRVFHCTHDWWYSDLHPSEYLDGFHDIAIDEMEDSFGTIVNYTHYTIDLPRDDFVWTRSGNYVLEVFSPYEPEEILISRRFVVYEDLSMVEAEVREPV